MRRISKRFDKEVIILEEEFLKNAYIDPDYKYDPSYKYESFYVEIDDRYERLGVNYLMNQPLAGRNYDSDIDVASIRLFSTNSGFTVIDDVIYRKSDKVLSTIYYNNPIILHKAKNTGDYKEVVFNSIYDQWELNEMAIIYLKYNGPDNILLRNINGIQKEIDRGVSKVIGLKNLSNSIVYSKRNTRKTSSFEFKYYLYNFLSEKIHYIGKDNSPGSWGGNSFEIDKILSKQEDNTPKIYNGNHLNILFSSDSSFGTSVLFEVLKKANRLIELPNIFDNDTTQNYNAVFEIDNFENYELAVHAMHRYQIKGIKIYGYELKDIMKAIDYGNEIYEIFGANWLGTEHGNVMKVIEKLKKYYKRYDDIELTRSLSRDYGKFSVGWNKTIYQDYLDYRLKNEVNIPGFLEYKSDKVVKQMLESYIRNAVLNDNVNLKWKSEVILYRLIQKNFPDSIFQYRADWLGMQSLDIFIPNLNLAIEYQGLQHYKPVEFFGGKKSFEANQERDERKRVLCIENNVDLIEWKYDFPINIFNLSKILKKRSIELSI